MPTPCTADPCNADPMYCRPIRIFRKGGRGRSSWQNSLLGGVRWGDNCLLAKSKTTFAPVWSLARQQQFWFQPGLSPSPKGPAISCLRKTTQITANKRARPNSLEPTFIPAHDIRHVGGQGAWDGLTCPGPPRKHNNRESHKIYGFSMNNP